MSTVAAHVWGSAPDFIGPRHELREHLLLRQLLKADPGPRVLNAGAGQGSFTRLLERRDYSVTSLDVSAAAVAVLRERVAGDVVSGDVVSLPFADWSFDTVVLGEVLEHVEDDAKALSEAARVMRPGGVLAVSVPAETLPLGPAAQWAGHVRHYSDDRLSQLCRGAGLQVETLRAWGFPLSALYHRYLYEPWLARRGADEGMHAPRLAHRALRAFLRVDRLFVGVRRGAVGYLLVARKTQI